MGRIGAVDLEILDLAARRGGTINEADMEGSALKRLGVGRILDALASLKDRGMVSLNRDGSFSMTDRAREVLWSDSVPAWARILRLLEIRSCTGSEIRRVLGLTQAQLEGETEGLRKSGMVLMSPQRRDGAVLRYYELLPAGRAGLEKAESEGFGGPAGIIREIKDMVSRLDADGAAKAGILERLDRLEGSL